MLEKSSLQNRRKTNLLRLLQSFLLLPHQCPQARDERAPLIYCKNHSHSQAVPSKGHGAAGGGEHREEALQCWCRRRHPVVTSAAPPPAPAAAIAIGAHYCPSCPALSWLCLGPWPRSGCPFPGLGGCPGCRPEPQEGHIPEALPVQTGNVLPAVAPHTLVCV